MFFIPVSLNRDWLGGRAGVRARGGLKVHPGQSGDRQVSPPRVITPQRSFYRTPKSLPGGPHANQARRSETKGPMCAERLGGAEPRQPADQVRSTRTTRSSHTHNGKKAVRATVEADGRTRVAD